MTLEMTRRTFTKTAASALVAIMIPFGRMLSASPSKELRDLVPDPLKTDPERLVQVHYEVEGVEGNPFPLNGKVWNEITGYAKSPVPEAPDLRFSFTLSESEVDKVLDAENIETAWNDHFQRAIQLEYNRRGPSVEIPESPAPAQLVSWPGVPRGPETLDQRINDRARKAGHPVSQYA